MKRSLWLLIWVDMCRGIFCLFSSVIKFSSALNAQLVFNKRQWIYKFSLINCVPQQDSENNHTANCSSVRGHLLFYKTSGRQWSSLASRWVLTLHHFWESGNRVRLSVLDLWEVPSISPAQVRKVLERHRGLSGTLIQHLLESLCKEEIKSGLKLIFSVFL